jgi:hypothetical protein
MAATHRAGKGFLPALAAISRIMAPLLRKAVGFLPAGGG